MNDDWQAEQERDLQMFAQEVVTKLLQARQRPLSDEEVMAIALEAGVANDLYKEMHK
jgi:trimethylamine:corrinoid methyltransferase-like protein